MHAIWEICQELVSSSFALLPKNIFDLKLNRNKNKKIGKEKKSFFVVWKKKSCNRFVDNQQKLLDEKLIADICWATL